MRVLKGHEAEVRCLSYSPDGRLLAAGDELNYVLLWSLPAGEEVGVLNRDNGSVEAVCFHPGGKLLAAGLPDHLVLWDVSEQEVITEAPAHPGGTRGLAWSADGTTLVSGGWDSTLRRWTSTLQAHGEPIRMPEPVTAVACTPDGTLVACGNGGRVCVLEGDSFSSAMAQHQLGLFSLAVSPDGGLVATGDSAGAIILWDSTALTVKGVLQGHEWTVYGLAFTPDGRRLVSGSADGTVRLWEGVPAGSWRLVETYRWHNRWVTCVAVAPDGMTAAAGSADCSIVVWDLADT